MRRHTSSRTMSGMFPVGDVCLRSGEEHPKVPGIGRLGFAKLDLYPNAKPKSVKPIRLAAERAAAEQEIVEDFLARG